MRELNMVEVEDVNGGMTLMLVTLFCMGLAYGHLLAEKDGACRVES